MAKKWTKVLMGTALLSGIAAAAYWYKKKYMDTPKYDEDLDDFDLDDYDFDEDDFEDSEDASEGLKNQKAAVAEEAVTAEENITDVEEASDSADTVDASKKSEGSNNTADASKKSEGSDNTADASNKAEGSVAASSLEEDEDALNDLADEALESMLDL